MDTRTRTVLLFDGVCNVCNGFVQCVIKRDADGYYRVAALQSEVAQFLLEESGYTGSKEISTVILVEDGRVFSHSDVGLKMVSRLGGLWPVLAIFQIIPKGIRDRIYNWVARNRYRWFGKQESCMIPTPDIQQRFLP